MTVILTALFLCGCGNRNVVYGGKDYPYEITEKGNGTIIVTIDGSKTPDYQWLFQRGGGVTESMTGTIKKDDKKESGDEKGFVVKQKGSERKGKSVFVIRPKTYSPEGGSVTFLRVKSQDSGKKTMGSNVLKNGKADIAAEIYLSVGMEKAGIFHKKMLTVGEHSEKELTGIRKIGATSEYPAAYQVRNNGLLVLNLPMLKDWRMDVGQEALAGKEMLQTDDAPKVNASLNAGAAKQTGSISIRKTGKENKFTVKKKTKEELTDQALKNRDDENEKQTEDILSGTFLEGMETSDMTAGAGVEGTGSFAGGAPISDGQKNETYGMSIPEGTSPSDFYGGLIACGEWVRMPESILWYDKVETDNESHRMEVYLKGQNEGHTVLTLRNPVVDMTITFYVSVETEDGFRSIRVNNVTVQGGLEKVKGAYMSVPKESDEAQADGTQAGEEDAAEIGDQVAEDGEESTEDEAAADNPGVDEYRHLSADATVKAGKLLEIDEDSVVPEGKTITVMRDATLSVSAKLILNGRILVDGGSVIVRNGGKIFPYEEETTTNAHSCEICCREGGSLVVEKGGFVCIQQANMTDRSAFCNCGQLRLTDGGSLYNYGIVVVNRLILQDQAQVFNHDTRYLKLIGMAAAGTDDMAAGFDAGYEGGTTEGNLDDAGNSVSETVYEQQRDELFIGYYFDQDGLDRLLTNETPDIWVDQDALASSLLTVGRCGSCISYYQNRQTDLKGHKIRIENGGGINLPKALAGQSDFTELVRGNGSVNGQ